MHFKKGDSVLLLSGRSQSQGGDRGKVGVVTKVLLKEGKATVTGINIRTRHTKPSMANPQGGRIERELPVAANRLMMVCPACNKPTRPKRILFEGHNVRACRRCAEQIPDPKGT